MRRLRRRFHVDRRGVRVVVERGGVGIVGIGGRCGLRVGKRLGLRFGRGGLVVDRHGLRLHVD